MQDTLVTKNIRRSMPKVRSGCKTCKARRVKCDEQRPECKRCMRSGRRCQGYDEVACQNAAGNIKIYSIPFKVPGSQADRQLLHFYCAEVAENISGFSDSTLWTHLILQRCHDHLVVRSSVVALSSLYQEHLRAGPSSLQVCPQSIEVISKCHRQLRLYLSTPDASPEVALICSLIFYTFECLVGDSKRALWHLDQGLALLQRVPIDYPHVVARPDGIFQHLATIFSRLDLQATTYDSSRMPGLNLVPPAEPEGMVSVVPDYFVSASNAEEVLTSLQNWMMQHMNTNIEFKGRMLDELPTSVRDERLRIDAQFQQFEVVTQLLAERIRDQNLESKQSSKQQQQILLLQMEAQVFRSILAENMCSLANLGNSPIDIESQLELALSNIETIVSMAKQINSSSNRPFTLSTQITAALYYICVKTTDSRTLQRALSLLQGPSLPLRDGLWDTKAALSIIDGMVSDAGMYSEGTKLEVTGSDILGAGGLEEVLQGLQVTKRNKQEILHQELILI